MTAPANDNNPADRPAWYDAKLVSYAPFARKCAHRLAPDDDVDDIVQDFYVDACRKWASYDDTYAFGTWVFQVVRNVVQARRSYHAASKRGARAVSIDVVVRMDNGGSSDEFVTERRCMAVPPNQHDYAELSAVLGQLTGRGGHVVLRQAMGDTLVEIGAKMGVTCERARQLAERERARLARVAA